MEAFLDFVVKGLVDRPDAVTVTPTERNGLTIYELRVHPTDMGKIIGRQGATINAIRALLLVGSAKRGVRCALEVVDEEGGGNRAPAEGGHSHSHSTGHFHGTPSQGTSQSRFGDRRPRTSSGPRRERGSGERRGTYSRY